MATTSEPTDKAIFYKEETHAPLNPPYWMFYPDSHAYDVPQPNRKERRAEEKSRKRKQPEMRIIQRAADVEKHEK